MKNIHVDSSKYFIDSDFIIDSRNRVVYYPNWPKRKGYILPNVDYVMKFRKIGQIIQWVSLLFIAVFWALFYMQLPIIILLLWIPIYTGILFLIRHLKITKPLKQFEISDEKFASGNSFRRILGSINGLLFWAVLLFFLVFLLIGLYTVIFNADKWAFGLFLTIFSGFLIVSVLSLLVAKRLLDN